MTHRDRTHIVLALVAEAVQDRAYKPYVEHLATLSEGIGRAVDHGAVADLWPPTGVDESHARWLASVLTGDADRDGRRGNDALVTAINATRRLADVAASLVVLGDSYRREAQALWDAASRLLGFEAEGEAEKPSQTNRTTTTPADTANPGHRLVLKENETLRFERDDARREIERFAESHVRSQDTIASLRSDLDSQTREHAVEVVRLTERIASLEADLAEQRADVRSGGQAKAAKVSAKHDPSPWSVIRLAVIHAGAKDFTVSYTGGKPTIVVDLGERLDISTVAKIIAEHGRAWYRLRAVGGGGWIEASRRKCSHREDGDDSACDHCSLKG